MSTHAKLAPSAAHRWMNCPGSIRESEGIESKSSVYADEGTFAHNIAADCLDRDIEASKSLGITDGNFTVDQTMVEHLQTYLDVVNKLAADARGKKVEEKVALHTIRKDIKGTADALVFHDTSLDVIDLKYGAGILVDVVNNPQLMIYALGALKTFVGLCLDVETVRIHVVQPRHYKGGHSMWAISKDDLLAWGEVTVALAAEATEDLDAKLCAGDWCQFCPAKPHCKQLRSEATERTKHLFADASMKTPAKTAPDPSRLTPVEISDALAAFPIIESWIKAVRNHAHEEAKKGTEIPGRKLVETVGNRKWRDDGEAVEMFELFGLHPYAEPKVLSPAQAEKKLSKKQRAGIMGSLAFKPKTGTALVVDSDRRPAITSGDVFDSLTND